VKRGGEMKDQTGCPRLAVSDDLFGSFANPVLLGIPHSPYEALAGWAVIGATQTMPWFCKLLWINTI